MLYVHSIYFQYSRLEFNSSLFVLYTIEFIYKHIYKNVLLVFYVEVAKCPECAMLSGVSMTAEHSWNIW